MKGTIRVFLLRQITVEVRGQKAWRNCILGEGKLSALPPAESNLGFSPLNFQEDCLDWKGELRCEQKITVGGFNTGNLVVKVCRR